MSINQKLSKLRYDKVITEDEYQILKKATKENETTYESILVWSDGCETNHATFTGKTQDEADSAARAQMHKENDNHCKNADADEDCGAYRGEWECIYATLDQDMCIWTIISVGQVIPAVEVQ